MKIVHIWYGTYPDVNPERDRRNALAQESWHHEYGRYGGTWLVQEMTSDRFWLNSSSSMPYVRDLIDKGIALCEECDVLFLTNADVGFAPGITPRILAVTDSGAAHLKRKEIGHDGPQPTTAEEIVAAHEYCGMDGTVMTPAWWRENRCLMPDMVWGRFGWDSCLRNLIRWKGGMEIKNALWHREHNSLWNSSLDVIYKESSNRHNRLMLWQWIIAHGGSEADRLFADGELQYR